MHLLSSECRPALVLYRLYPICLKRCAGAEPPNVRFRVRFWPKADIPSYMFAIDAVDGSSTAARVP
jgi:hypothetical protein